MVRYPAADLGVVMSRCPLTVTAACSGRGEDRQVLADVLGEVRWQVDGPVPGGGLRCGDESLPTDSDSGLLNGDGPFGQVDVAAPQGGEFTEPQSAPSGEQDQQPVARGHRIRES